MIQIIKPDSPVQEQIKKFSIFLAGSIEMGVAEDWQTKVQQVLKDYDITIFNPRRESWDSSWAQSIDNPQFKAQVDWELDHLEKCDLILMYFDENTKSPISLLELGAHADNAKMLVCCPPKFFRKGNVDIFCFRKGIPVYENLEEILTKTKGLLDIVKHKLVKNISEE